MSLAERHVSSMNHKLRFNNQPPKLERRAKRQSPSIHRNAIKSRQSPEYAEESPV